MDEIRQYFDEITQDQATRLHLYEQELLQWNAKINLISRKDTSSFKMHHLLHALSIAKVVTFKKDTTIMDIGSGGGLPGIPLAIYFPNVHFHLVDSIGKKAMVLKEICSILNLQNVTVWHNRAEDVDVKIDFVICRAVAHMSKIIHWSKNKFNNHSKNKFPNGYFCLKGGDLTHELEDTKKKFKKILLSEMFDNEYFNEKFILYTKA